MSFRYTLILLAVAIVAIAGFGLAQRAAPPASGPAATPTPELLDLSPAEVTDLDVKTSGKETELVKNGTTWQLSKPSQDPNVDQAKVSQIVGQLAPLDASRSVAKSTDDLTPYGLKSPQLTVSLTGSASKQEVLLVGDKNLNGNQYYAMRQGGSDVGLIESSVVDGLTGLANNPPRATPAPSPAADGSPAGEPSP